MCTNGISSGLLTETKGNNLKKPDIVLIARWVKKAWNEIPAEMVMKSFNKYCINNKLDGIEDDTILSDCYEIDFSDLDICANVYDDAQMRAKGFDELFGKSDPESEFEGF